MSTEKFLFEIAADTKALREELSTGKASVKKFKNESDGMLGNLESLKAPLSAVATGVAAVTTAVVAGTSALVSYAAAQGRTIQETETMANIAGLTVEEFKRLSFVFGTVGIDGEKFGDIMKDTQEKVGDFLATGGGAFQDFADVMGYTSKEAQELAGEFETMSGQDVLQEMVNRMDAAGKSTQQMSFALEGMASDTTALIPLLRDGGEAAQDLADTFDSINVELSEEERAQFAALANNVDLAQGAFVNFLNNAIAPFLPAINEATKALAEFFAARQTGMDLDRIIDEHSLADQVTSLEELEKLQKLLNEEVETYENLTHHGRSGKVNKERLKELKDTLPVLEARKQAIEEENEATQRALDLESKKGNLKSERTSGADSIKLEEQLLNELKAVEDANKSELQLLQDQKNARLAILESMYEDEKNLTKEKLDEKNAMKMAIEADYLAQSRELAQTEEQAKIDAAVTESETLKELLDEKLISQEEYQAKLKEIIAAYSPESVDPEALEEKNQAELESLNEKLENQLISYEDYFTKLGALSKKDSADKKKKTELENFWSESSVKSQIDDGTALLSALGNNSKTAHKIKQGLAAGNTVMTTAENIAEQFPNPAGMASAALVGATQLATIMSSTPDGGGTITTPSATANEAPVENYSDQGTSVTDISGDDISTQRMIIEFSDEAVEVVGRHIKKAESERRI
ncbi:hypothetical protein [Alteromonas australica]|uniref:Uncharacterized protein n=2 Tax=Alteromonas australica TaxID=589873 RepID=A0A358E1C1_9ALTE|nr:hypothetical protein [Alteromonas australica]MBU35305.1 hypothetical protein [Alteromonas sp.]HBU52207.1 hypothetical protein [Alteromonas australica]|tara:strand:- start:9842 stop:11926 length:2085 start_codon:yes stop_codon:yes gene_type:complete